MIHPSGFQTSDFEIYKPTKAQVFSAAWRARDYYIPRKRYRPNPYVLTVILLLAIFFVIKILIFG